MASRIRSPNAAPPLAPRRLRGLYVAGALVVSSAFAFQWWNASQRPRKVPRARAELISTKERPEEASAYLALTAPLPRPAGVTPAPAISLPSPPAASEPTEAERRQARKNRFDHIQAAFQAQTATDFDPVRAREFEARVEPALSEVARSSETLELGSMECRGRMCGVDVAFEEPTDASAMHRAVNHALLGLNESPHVHLVTHAGDDGRANVGRLFFEWPERRVPGDGAEP